MRKKIMVVDDDDCVRLAYTGKFISANYEVKGAATGEEALQLMRNFSAEVLFLDLNLPDTNGLELCKKIREKWPWCICIAVTGCSSVFELISCREVGFEDYFIKPVKLEVLVEVAETAFKKIKRSSQREAALAGK